MLSANRLRRMAWSLPIILSGWSSIAAPPHSPVVRSEVDPPEDSLGPRIDELIQAHNRRRAEADLEPLSANPKLLEAAREHARDMAEHKHMAHEGSDGSTPKDRIEKALYHYLTMGENVAAGQTSVSQVMEAWMNSPHHRENILGDFHEIGAARVADRDGRLYWCTTFGRPIPKFDPSDAAAGLVRELNRLRAESKRPPISAEDHLQAAALFQARIMAEQGKLDAEAEDGLNPFERVQKAGYSLRKAALGMASGQPTPEAVAEAWMKEPADRENLVGSFSQAGIGYATATNGTPYWCVIFAQPR